MLRSRSSLRPHWLTLLLAATLSAPLSAGNSDGLPDGSFGTNGFVSWYDGGQVTVADLATSNTAAYPVGTVTLVGEEPALHWKGFDQAGDEANQGCAQASDTLFTLATESNGLAGLIDSSGNLLVGGWAAFFGTETTRRALVARFDLSGNGCVLDDSFSGNGWAIFNAESFCDTEQCDVVDLVEIRPETGAVLAPRIVALVRSEVNGLVSRFFLLGLTASGAIDTDFDNGWKEVTKTGIGPLFPNASLAVDGVGRIYVLAARYEPDTVDIDALLFRYQANGAVDSGFPVGGMALLEDHGPNDSFDTLPRDVAISADGTSVSAIQLDADEAKIDTFRSAPADVSLFELVVASVAIQGNGRVVVLGEHGDGSDGFELRRDTLGPLGELDTDLAFAPGGGFVYHDIDLGGSNSETAAAVAIWNGRALVAGTAQSSVGNAGFLLRTWNYFVFADSFEQGAVAYWSDVHGFDNGW